MDSMNSYGVLILAGGRSSRMKYPKPWLPLKDETTFLEHLTSLYFDNGFKDIVVVLNHKFYSAEWKRHIQKVERQSRIIKNSQVEKGRLFSIKIGLQHLTKADFVFIQNIDNPFIDKKVITALRQNVCINGVSVPTFKGKGGHPVLISRKIKNSILNGYKSSVTLRDVFKPFDRKNVKVKSESILLNINTFSDYKKALSKFV